MSATAAPPRLLVISPTAEGAEKMVRLLSVFPSLVVIGGATDLANAMLMVEHDKPDLVLLSKRFRGSPESDVLMAILREKDIRWLELSNRSAGEAQQTRPPKLTSGLFEVDASTPPRVLVSHIHSVCRNNRAPAQAQKNTISRLISHPFKNKIILIGSSTGGVDCLLSILENFTADCPPTLIVQHTGNDFLTSLITLLDRRSPITIAAAQNGQEIHSGTAAVAGDGAQHLTLKSRRPAIPELVPAPPDCGHRPSVDALFNSAVPYAKHIVAALLTGMGRDGAAGMLALRRAGAITLAQDEATSTVYGMPRAAKEMQAVDHILSISDLGSVLSGRKRLPRHSNGAPL